MPRADGGKLLESSEFVFFFFHWMLQHSLATLALKIVFFFNLYTVH